MDNRKFLESLGYEFTGVDIVDNMRLQTKMPIQSSVIYLNNIKITPEDDFNKLYIHSNWVQLSLQDKLTVLYWSMKQYLQDNGISKMPEIYFIEKDMQKYNCNAYIKDNKIILNLEYFNSANGYDCLFTLLHESTHYKDAVEKLQTIEDVQKYVKGEVTYRKIMELPVSEKIFNYQANCFEELSKEDADKILRLKNSFIGSSKYHKNLKEINNIEDFNKYIDNIFYVCCPLEVNANFSAYEYVDEIFQTNGDYNTQDIMAMKKKENTIDYIIENIAKMKKIYNVTSLKEAQNIEIVGRFNELEKSSGNNKMENISPQLIEKREKELKRVYLKKLGGRV